MLDESGFWLLAVGCWLKCSYWLLAVGRWLCGALDGFYIGRAHTRCAPTGLDNARNVFRPIH
jgi:hypothetical protein